MSKYLCHLRVLKQIIESNEYKSISWSCSEICCFWTTVGASAANSQASFPTPPNTPIPQSYPGMTTSSGPTGVFKRFLNWINKSSILVEKNIVLSCNRTQVLFLRRICIILNLKTMMCSFDVDALKLIVYQMLSKYCWYMIVSWAGFIQLIQRGIKALLLWS